MPQTPFRHKIILLDIDGTIIDNRASERNKQVVYTAGFTVWRTLLQNFKDAAFRAGIMIHYGIATAKMLYFDDYMREKGWQGDYLSRAILGEAPLATEKEQQDIAKNNLGDLIDPKLVFFIGEEHQAMVKKRDAETAALTDKKLIAEKIKAAKLIISQLKATHALAKAKSHLETEFKIRLKPNDLYLLEDSNFYCQGTLLHHYNVIFLDTEFIESQSRKLQEDILTYIFTQLLTNHIIHGKLSEKSAEDLYEIWKDELGEILFPPSEICEINNNVNATAVTIEDITPVVVSSKINTFSLTQCFNCFWQTADDVSSIEIAAPTQQRVTPT